MSGTYQPKINDKSNKIVKRMKVEKKTRRANMSVDTLSTTKAEIEREIIEVIE